MKQKIEAQILASVYVHKIYPEERAALQNATATGADVAELPGGLMFINRGEDYGPHEYLNCPHCGEIRLTVA